MNDLFLKIINMSISASWLVLAVLLLRFVLKKAPKWVNVLLWGIVAVRLAFPFSIESALSLIPSAETVPMDIEMAVQPTINSGVPVINSMVNPMLSSFAPPQDVLTSANPLQIWIPIFSILWIAGIAALLLYTVVSYWRLRRKVSEAVILRDNIFQSENVASPFVLGVFRPKIYLPYNMGGQDLNHVVAHEQAHIRRRDHWWKPLGFLLLTIHWFNPLMWLAYVLLCRDIELACDEKVIKVLGNEQRADYTQALVACSVNRRVIAACPLAFGEVGVKERVKSVMNYKKPAFWIVVLAVIACVVVAVCFLTDPEQDSYIMMPEMDGISAMVKIREKSNVPIILLTAKSEDTDKILGLNTGADDYITKPFNPVEVTARVRSQLRRYMQLGSRAAAPARYVIGGVELDDSSKEVTLDGEPISLTPIEYDILKLLMESPGKVYSPKEIYRQVWKEAPLGSDNTVAVHIRHLREKIEINPADPRYLKVVWGQGYKMEKGAKR